MDDDLFEEKLQTRKMIRNHLVETLRRSLSMVNDDILFCENYYYDFKLVRMYLSKRNKILKDLSKYSNTISYCSRV
jgi:hypothetical protein